jgi:5-methylcytosine-specific restriction enzyme subunit McrC
VSDNRLVLDTKWKLIDDTRANGTEKYGLTQADFYQLHAYGQSYLDGEGDVVLIYPKTDTFSKPLDVFDFPKTAGLRLWVLPFCLQEGTLAIPKGAPFAASFNRGSAVPRPT